MDSKYEKAGNFFFAALGTSPLWFPLLLMLGPFLILAVVFAGIGSLFRALRL